jgi:hypothetical protein
VIDAMEYDALGEVAGLLQRIARSFGLAGERVLPIVGRMVIYSLTYADRLALEVLRQGLGALAAKWPTPGALLSDGLV